MQPFVPTTGAILSEPDYRDGIAASAVLAGALMEIATALPTLPEVFQTDLAAIAVMDQNKIPACVSHAWALVMKYWWWKEHGELVDFSPRFLDILSKEDYIPFDGGRAPRTVCKVSKDIGCCTTALLPNDTDLKPGETVEQAIRRYRGATITQAMRDEAAKYKIPGYIKIRDNTITDFRMGVKQFGLVSGLFAISDAFWTRKDGVISWAEADLNPLRVKPSTSNHQMVVNGWIGDLNSLRNSWSKFWNQNGDGDYNAQQWLDYIYEGWAIAKIPDDVQTLLSNLPKPGDMSYVWNRDLAAGNATADDDVKFAQIALMILGIMPAVAPEQLGFFGPKTEKAVLAYQALKKIPIASRNPKRIGPLTRGFLNKDFAA